MKIALGTFAALVGSLALLNVFSNHHDLMKYRGCAFGMPGMPGATHFTLKGGEYLHLDKAQMIAIEAELPIVTNKRISLSGEGEFVRPKFKPVDVTRVHNIVME